MVFYRAEASHVCSISCVLGNCGFPCAEFGEDVGLPGVYVVDVWVGMECLGVGDAVEDVFYLGVDVC